MTITTAAKNQIDLTRGLALYDPTTGAPVELQGDDGNAHVAEQNNITGLRNPSSSTNAWVPVRPGTVSAVVISTTSAVAIGGSSVANDRQLIRVQAHTALAGTCVIAGLVDETGTAKSYTLPIGFVGERNFDFALNAAGALTVTCSTAGDDDKVVVTYAIP